MIEYQPAALRPGQRLPVAGDGTILRGIPVEGSLPEDRAASGAARQPRLTDPAALDAAARRRRRAARRCGRAWS